MQIYIGSDHAGYEVKEKLKKYLSELGLGYEVKDLGAFKHDPDDDYPDFVRPVAEAVAENPGSFGIVLGKSGQGEAMCANRVPGARAGVFYSEAIVADGKDEEPYEMIKLLREHNDANILSLSARFLSEDQIKFATELFLKTPFSGQERHIRRIKKIDYP